MKDFKLLLEKLRLRGEREFEKDVKILLDIKKYRDDIRALNREKGESEKQNLSVIMKSLNSSIAYVEKVYSYLKRRTLFEHSYYNNVLNSYHKSGYYDEIMYSEVQGEIQGELASEQKRDQLMNFFHMYLMRKYCERSFYKCLHSRFARSITYNYLEKSEFHSYIESDVYFLYSYMQTFAYILLKNDTLNMYLIKICSEMISKTYAELSILRGKIKHKNVMLLDDKQYVPHNSLLKYVYFIIEHLCKNKNYDYLNVLNGIYSCIYVFSNVYYTCGLSFNKAKAEMYIREKESLKNSDKKSNTQDDEEDTFNDYYRYIEQYANQDFMELNEMLLYFISKEKLKRVHCSINDIMRDFNIVKHTTNLEKLFFMEVFVGGECPVRQKEKYNSIRMDIYKRICDMTGKCPLYMEVAPEGEKGNITHFDNMSTKEIGYSLQNLVNHSDDIITSNSEANSLEDCFYNHLFFEKAKFNIDDVFFNKNVNTIDITGEIEFVKDFSCPEKIEKESFLKLFNDNYDEDENYLRCIDEFYHISIDFDKTIIKKDSYSFFFKMLEKKYYNYNKHKDIILTEEDIFFFNNFTIEQMNGKKDYCVDERMESLHKISQWFTMREKSILNELHEMKNISEPYSNSYYYYLNLVDKLHLNYSKLLAYYDILKDVDVDVINDLINDYYEKFELNDHFLEIFLYLMNYKQNNKETFYFDIITLNFKKKICLYVIRNNLLKLKCDTKKETSADENAIVSHNASGNICKETDKAAAKEADNWYALLKENFNVYYSKTHTYDKEKRKYTGNFEYDRLKIKHNNYGQSNNVERLTFASLFDKTLIRSKVCSLLTNINHKLSSFIGDSLIDLDAMLSTDIPILLGHNDLVIAFCEKHNILIKPLVFAAAKIELLRKKRTNNSMQEGTERKYANEGSTCDKFEVVLAGRDKHLNEIYDEKQKVIYSTESWLEIGVFLFGNI
ncbi:conserved Plasmodium protein, unknown function [Plasmodium ovale]|uniref:Uncharacterized protein n=2 Tax=Plasmodium ovale TaxID=36330 RepID=A0A1A8W3V4_PLAOA|nr:conserved Plasmodium protein, unknown function [Plasmodium ovale curtisi]SCP06205.1 conserved Plasmodium protein, unknown function [Plasmodium ovale]